MANKHILKNSDTECVLKCYIEQSAGGVVEISLENDLTKTETQVYIAPTSVPNEQGVNGLGPFVEYNGSRVMITGIWWGLKAGKQLDITRVINPTGPVLHGHYYLVNSGFYEYDNFSDRVYANKDIRLVFDGPGHCILRLRKEGWHPKIETGAFGVYDDITKTGE